MLARHYTTGGYAAAIFPLGEYGPLRGQCVDLVSTKIKTRESRYNTNITRVGVVSLFFDLDMVLWNEERGIGGGNLHVAIYRCVLHLQCLISFGFEESKFHASVDRFTLYGSMAMQRRSTSWRTDRRPTHRSKATAPALAQVHALTIQCRRRLLSISSAAFLCLSLPVFESLSVYQLYVWYLSKKKESMNEQRKKPSSATTLQPSHQLSPFSESVLFLLLLTHRCVHSIASPLLCRQYKLRTQANSTYRTTRGQTFISLCLPLVTRRSGELTPLHTSSLLYNNLPSELRSPNISFSLFHCTIMKYLGHPVRRP